MEIDLQGLRKEIAERIKGYLSGTITVFKSRNWAWSIENKIDARDDSRRRTASTTRL